MCRGVTSGPPAALNVSKGIAAFQSQFRTDCTNLSKPTVKPRSQPTAGRGELPESPLSRATYTNCPWPPVGPWPTPLSVCDHLHRHPGVRPSSGAATWVSQAPAKAHPRRRFNAAAPADGRGPRGNAHSSWAGCRSPTVSSSNPGHRLENSADGRRKSLVVDSHDWFIFRYGGCARAAATRARAKGRSPATAAARS